MQNVSQQDRSLLKTPQRHSGVFISFAIENLERAEHYRALLDRAGFSVFAFHLDLRIGASIQSVVRETIQQCDYFLFLVSSHSASPERPWVARELGLARETQKLCETRPVIIPILCSDVFSPDGALQIQEFPVRNFYTGETEPTFDLSVRAHAPDINPSTDKDERLVAQMLPQVMRVGTDLATEDEFRDTGVLELYERIFPEEEQVPSDAIVAFAFRHNTNTKVRLKERSIRSLNPTIYERLFGAANFYEVETNYFVLLLNGTAIGFAHLSYVARSRLVYGYYIGIAPEWRAGNKANYFIQHIKAELFERYPLCLGVVFDVLPISEHEINASLNELEAGRSDEELRRNLSRLNRITWYESIGAQFFWDRHRNAPVVHTYPCMDPGRPEADWPSFELNYWLMFLPTDAWKGENRNALDLWREGLHATLIEALAKRMSIEYPEKAERYYSYVRAIYKRCVAATGNADVVMLSRYRFRSKDLRKRLRALNRKFRFGI